ncbi:MAG: Ni/Fe-hydrogenase, b-type cytochrome subunit [Candidatus Thiodiazotropha sp.]
MQSELRQSSVYVYEAPVRLWHWVNALSITLLAITGYLIANPLPSMPGEASDHYLMGTIRFIHFVAAYVFTVGFIGRIYWAIVGNEHAGQLFSLPLFKSRTYWKEVLYEIRWYAFLEREPKKYIGHNPLAHLVMVTIITVGGFFMVLTGFALYAEQTGLGSWQDSLFGWLIPLVGQSQDVRLWQISGWRMFKDDR